MYDTYQYLAGRPKGVDLPASLILISGCQDNQLSQDGDRNGLFTENLLNVWSSGGFQGDYHSFWQRILANMPPTQQPNYYTLGDVSAFASERPFTIETQQFKTDGVNPQISIIGETARQRSATAPDFRVDTQGAPYYVVEFATSLPLFDGDSPSRNSGNFYGSWSDSPLLQASNGFYPMPNSAWNAMKQADRIYFRVGTTTSQTGYENYRTSDDSAASGPSLTLVG